MPQTQKFDHLNPPGEILCRKDDNFNVQLLEIRFEGWCTCKVHLWSTFENSQ